MTSWMVYAALVALLLAAAAWILERAVRDYRLASRWIWAGALVASSLLPLLALIVPGDAGVLPAPVAGPGSEAYPPPGPLATLEAPAGAVGPLVIEESRRPAVPRLPESADPFVLVAWLLLSLGLASGLFQAYRSLARDRRGWLEARVDGRNIFVSDALGPALVGVIRQAIVMPRWALALPGPDRELMLRHEEEHQRAGDAPLLLAAVVLLTLLPWNLPLWWQMRRLRLAVEVDCDRRVLRSGRELRRYAVLLVEIGRRRTCPPLAVALAEPASFLERRIRMMTSRPKPKHLRTAVLMLASALLVGAVAEIEEPTASLERVPPANATVSVSRPAEAPAQPSEVEAARTRAPRMTEPLPSAASQDLSAPAATEETVVPAEQSGGATPASRITGTVTDAATSQPLADARVYLVGTNLAAISSASGGYLLIDVAAGTYEMRVERAGYATATRVVALTDDAVLETSFALTASSPPTVVDRARLGRINGRVTDAFSGAPLADVQVYLVDEYLGAITRQTGVYIVLNVPPGTYTLRAERIGLSSASQEIVVTEGEALEVNFELTAAPGAEASPPATIRFRGEDSVNPARPPIIVIDGVRVTPADGNVFNSVNPEEIERVEVIKGEAAMGPYGYGEEAAGGVIRIFRKKRPDGAAADVESLKALLRGLGVAG